jgi:uncharacterized protein YxeA
MKKTIIAAAIVVVAVLTSLTLISKSANTKHAELVKVNKAAYVSNGFATQKSDLSSAD